jgi:hypothetical protein
MMDASAVLTYGSSSNTAYLLEIFVMMSTIDSTWYRNMLWRLVENLEVNKSED